MTSTTTAAETLQFTERFKRFIQRESGADLKSLREQAFAYFEQVGFPTPKTEDWKYTNVAPIAKVDWRVVPLMSASELDSHLKRLAAFNFRRNGIAALNLAFASHISVIVIPKDTRFAEPINLGFAAAYRSGLERASLPYFTFLPGDNEVAPESVQAIFDAIGRADLVVPYHGTPWRRAWRAS